MKEKLKTTELIEMLGSFQEKYDVTQIKSGDICVWPIILFEIAKVHTPENNNSLAKPIAREIKEFIKMQLSAITDKNKSDKKTRQADVIFLTQSTRRVKLGRVYYDRICDPFVDAFSANGISSITLEWAYDREYKVPRYNSSVFIQVNLYTAIIKSFFIKSSLSGDCILKSNEFNIILKHMNLSHRELVNAVLSTINKVVSIKEWFKSILESSTAKYAFYYPFYGVVSYAFNLACKERNIYTVELQHGLGLSLMKNAYKCFGFANGLLPDAVWCWDEEEVKAFKKMGFDCRKMPRIYIGGNLWINYWKSPHTNRNVFYKSYKAKISNYEHFDYIIVLTLPPSIIIKQLWLFNAIEETSRKCLWLVRLHHNTEKKVVYYYKNKLTKYKNVDIENASALPLPLLFEKSNVHVTINSSSVFEAKECMVKSIITDEAGIKVFETYIEDGWAYFANSLDGFRKAFAEIIMGDSVRNESGCSLDMSNKMMVKKFLLSHRL